MSGHIPVLLQEMLDALAPRDGGIYLDGTFGGGGYTAALLDAAACTVWAIDRDPQAIARGADLAARFPGRLHLLEGNFADLLALLTARGVTALDGVVLDLGVSSFQLDTPDRGFSFRTEGPLDMRMGRAGPTAADLVNSLAERDLADILYTLGEERASRRIARAIVAARDASRLPKRTAELARLIAGVVHVRGKRERVHPATRTFQALRIAVNDELGSLERGLAAAIGRTRTGGRIAVISFQSLEDRIVKQRFRDDERVRALTKKPLLPGDDELARNPRARSAKLRVAERD
jgi:16S rRNA (cytosine1402-N4)-methyltransferase